MAEVVTGQVVVLPVPPRLCGSCANAALHPAGPYCLEWQQSVVDERWAEDCEAFDPTAWGA